MTELDPQEEAQWLKGLQEFDEMNKNTLLAAFAVFGIPGHYLDVGSGSGVMVRTARQLGAEAFGIDLIHQPEPFFFFHDMTTPFKERLPNCGIVTSIEVAEHIEEVGVENYCDTLTKFVAPGGFLILTAAPPGQPGHRHVNCQPAYYWRERMYNRKLMYNEKLTYQLALVWTAIHSNMHHLEANLQVFTR